MNEMSPITRPAYFRAEAEMQPSHLDQLSTTLRLVPAGYPVAVGMLFFCVVAAVFGAMFIEVPITVTGTGVVLSSKGVLEFTVASDHDGRVLDMDVDVGQSVVPGQPIARISAQNLETDLKLEQGKLELVRQERAAVLALQADAMRSFEAVQRQQIVNANTSLSLLQRRQDLLEQVANGQDFLRRNGNTTSERYLQVQADLASVMEAISSTRGQLLKLGLDSIERKAQNARELQALGTRQAEAQREVDRLRERISTETTVRSTQYGVISALRVFPGDLVRFNTPLVSVLPADESFAALRPAASHLVANVLIPAKDGKKVKVGMTVLVDPTSVRRDVFGSIRARVVRTSDVAISPEQLSLILRNDDLVRKLTANGPPFLVTTEMERTTTTPSGLRWTTSNGPQAEITAGTLIEAKVLTERVSVLGLIMPALKDLLRGPRSNDADL